MSRKKTTQQRKYSLLGLGIAEIEKDTGLQRKDFAHKLGFTPVYLTQLITGQKNNPSDRFFAAMSREFGANKMWLQKREGPKYKSTRVSRVSAPERPYHGEDRRKEQRRKFERRQSAEDQVLIVDTSLVQRIEGCLYKLERRFGKLEEENRDLRARLDEHQKAPGHFEALR